ncbi:MAG TPA: acylphosphatase, partial [Actinomycetospora sp.]|nr:acylphosphatase [Actinomycetospora sp.]
MTVPPPVRVRVHVGGIVQGVGFRPFVHGLAGELGLAGTVGNDATGVVVEVEGGAAAVDEFVSALRERPPALAVVESVCAEPIPATGAHGLVITASTATGARAALVSADTATCDACLAELRDPTDRRYRFPFVNCTHCGPRLTIVRDVPYDRATTTMAAFPMCAPCAAEYHDPADRRFHAQPTCCPDCGPTLSLHPHGPGDPVRDAAARLREGAVLAVKGLGGYHLAVRADDAVAVARLRAAKHREDKPFAVMAPSLDAARALVDLQEGAVEVLTSRRAPIVLLPRRRGAA